MSGEDDPLLAEIRERLAKVEARLDSTDHILKDLKDRVKNLDNRLWAVLITVILTIVLTILKIIV